MGGGRDGDSDGSNFLGKGGGGINTLQIRLDQLLGSWWQPLCQARYHKTEAIFNNDRRWYWRTTRVFLPFLSHPLLTRHRLISNTQFLPFFDPFLRFFFSSKQIPKKCSRDKCKLAAVFLIILSFLFFSFFSPLSFNRFAIPDHISSRNISLSRMTMPVIKAWNQSDLSRN